ncbi:hypothetical protein Pyrfu_0923 [Pyrolobus fumarii 1A]|uniref:Uncharacterized protein n=1 Tax=Pyrolobus fumarii (strain DSM 11204 / 1A) TaxID=694429 RepID=G0EE98_PYRF1|nr:hypothetical protein Pyrfu_0923 [Pyrolobus fumarii 1A]
MMMQGAVVRLLRSLGYHTLLNRVIEGMEVDAYAVKQTSRGYRGLIVEMKVLYRDSLRVQVERRRHLAHRVYVALPDWGVYDAIAGLPAWTGIIAYDPVSDKADIVRKALPNSSLLADMIATAMAIEAGLAMDVQVKPWHRDGRSLGAVKRP